MRMPPHIGKHWTDPLDQREERRPAIRLRWYLLTLVASLAASYFWPWGFAS